MTALETPGPLGLVRRLCRLWGNGSYWSDTTSTTDVQHSRNDHDIDRCDSDLSFSDGCFNGAYGSVRRHSIPFFFCTHCGQCRRRVIDDRDRANTSRPIAFAPPKSNRVPVHSITLGTAGVAVHCEQYQTSQTNQDCSPIGGQGSLRDKSASPGLDYNVERGAESRTWEGCH